MMKRLCEIKQRLTVAGKTIIFRNLKNYIEFHTSVYLKSKNLYDILELTPYATQSQIKAAYYRLSMIHHPDKVKQDNNLESKFQEITEAYEVLSNVESRKNYDRGMLIQSPLGLETSFNKQNPRKRPAHLGKTEIYNFDEFYRMHYGDAMEKRRVNKMHYEDFVKRKETQSTKKFSSYEGIGLLTVLLFIFVLASYVREENVIYDKPPPMESKSKNP